MIEQGEHPADKLALALSRASGIVASVAHCYSERTADFSVSLVFIAQALKTIENFINDADDSLGDLNRDYDLTIPKPDLATDAQPGDPEIRGAVATLTPHDDAVVAETANDDLEPFIDLTNEDVARTYDELLAKVTAAEVFASNSAQYAANSENDLVPLLSSLKADLLRLRSVA